jgi:hypothetical protein
MLTAGPFSLGILSFWKFYHWNLNALYHEGYAGSLQALILLVTEQALKYHYVGFKILRN